MYAVATCRGSILRGSTESEFGDEEDNETVAASGVLARIKSERRRVFDSATQTARTVRVPMARVQSDTDIKAGDRFRDDTHGGVIYAVIDVDQPDQQGRQSDLVIELRKLKPAE
ncbi:hypothetical protein BBK82_03350 [Lentzea guizhouensis]|uniref:Head-tail adaptor protein n=1 Tax=Lentzea guizhouensis TaxID=1586287 RepID=A0A1B2HBZ4_9PSEU|nr:hypothetical protein BBK82_03350 [Lentzea guizhouensis]